MSPTRMNPRKTKSSAKFLVFIHALMGYLKGVAPDHTYKLAKLRVLQCIQRQRARRLTTNPTNLRNEILMSLQHTIGQQLFNTYQLHFETCLLQQKMAAQSAQFLRSEFDQQNQATSI